MIRYNNPADKKTPEIGRFGIFISLLTFWASYLLLT